jgi:hypothetical protein
MLRAAYLIQGKKLVENKKPHLLQAGGAFAKT